MARVKKEIVIEIDYRPRYEKLHEEIAARRFNVIVAHRRFGKTVLAINHLIRSALLCEKPMGIFGYVAPQLKQAKKNSWKLFKKFTAKIPFRKINESELRIDLPCPGGETSVWLYGADNPDSIRGSYFDGVIMDEVAQMKPEVWGEIIRPMLADRKGWALFIGTPKGVNLFSGLYYSALEKMKKGDPDWGAWLFPVTETNALSEKEVADMKNELSENAFRQEMLCDFNAACDNNLIGFDDVMAAMERELDPRLAERFPVILGVDIARFGDDSTVFFRRQGRIASPPVVLNKLNNVDVANRLIACIHETRPQIVCIDQGQGTGVIDLVRNLAGGTGARVVEVPFGSRANDSDRYFNRRSEMWTLMRDWIAEGADLPNNTALLAELTAPLYSYDNQGRIKLEPKEIIKDRLNGKSTDLADALALTFALPAPPLPAEEERREWIDPFTGKKTSCKPRW